MACLSIVVFVFGSGKEKFATWAHIGEINDMNPRHVPVYVISGFLGAGKTTLLNRVLTADHGRRFAVIVNEFGEVGLDGSLVEGTQDFVKMDNGCLCCALNAELMETVEKLKNRDDFDAVILETTGVADPLPVAWTFFRERFAGYFRFGGIVTVADVLNFSRMNDEALEVVLQIERADYLYVSKTGAVPPAQVGAFEILLKDFNPNARLVRDTDPKWLDLLFDFGGDEKTLAELHGHHHDHAKKFDSVAVPLAGKAVRLSDMEDLFEALPKNVFRAKAAFKDADSGKTYVMHSVCGRVEFYETNLAIAEPVAIFIGKDFGAGDLAAGLGRIS